MVSYNCLITNKFCMLFWFLCLQTAVNLLCLLRRKSPALRPFSKHFYDECQPVKDRPPFPLPSESTKVPENPLYDAVAPDENPSRFKKFGRSVKTMVTSNSRKFGHHIAQKYGNISAINIPAFKVASPLEHDPNNLSNYDQSEFTPSTSQN